MILENITRLCKRQNITLHELEKATGLGNGVIRRWDDGRPRVDLLKKVADYFGCTVDDLIREDSA